MKPNGGKSTERVDALCRAWSAVLVQRAKARQELREAQELVRGVAREPDSILAAARARAEMIDRCIAEQLRSKASIADAAHKIRARLAESLHDACVVGVVDRFAQIDRAHAGHGTEEDVMREAMELVQLAALVGNLRDAGYRSELVQRSQGALPDAGPLLARMRAIARGAKGRDRALKAAFTLLRELDADAAPPSRAALERRYRLAQRRSKKKP